MTKTLLAAICTAFASTSAFASFYSLDCASSDASLVLRSRMMLRHQDEQNYVKINGNLVENATTEELGSPVILESQAFNGVQASATYAVKLRVTYQAQTETSWEDWVICTKAQGI